MDEILINVDFTLAARKLIKMGLLLGNNLHSKINIIVAEKNSTSEDNTEIKSLKDSDKLESIKGIIDNEADSLDLENSSEINIDIYYLPNCRTTKKIELVSDFIDNHNILYYITSIKNDNPIPFHIQNGAKRKTSLSEILGELACPTIIVNEYFNTLNIEDIGLFFSKIENENIQKYHNLKILSDIFDSKIHLMAIVEPDSIENSKIISSLQKIADKYGFKNHSINTVINNNIVEGINFFSHKRVLDMIVVLNTNGSKLLEKENLIELINTNRSPIFCYWP